VLDAGMFRPANDAAGRAAQVVVTPLSRAVWRPFAAVVFPGCDAQHLGAAGEPWPWITQAEAQGLGLPTAAARLAQERAALCGVLGLPHVTLLRRQADGDAPLSASPLLEHLLLALGRRGLDPGAQDDTATWVDVPLTPSLAPLPCIDAARALWPTALSATSVEALRTCPYQFFARAVLGLREADELTDEIERRDVGTWLHAVLKAFHDERGDPPDQSEGDLPRLQEIASRKRAEMGLEAEAFLPHAAWFEQLAPAYLAWLRDHEADGWHYAQGEADRSVAPTELSPWGIELKGRLDRVDTGREGNMVIDYKTGSMQRLRAKLSDAQEDTQLPFYAVLQGDEAAQAAYLPLEVLPLKLLTHEGAAADGVRLVAHLSLDWQRMAQGEPLPALGEGEACEFCEMRGLCRRDHWARELAADAPAKGRAEVQP
jgi:ATP-dependent helicase/nuclease subunit B